MIEVATPDSPDEGWKFDEATKWHVDDRGFLHLQYPDKGGNAATFAPGAWTSVVDITTDPATTIAGGVSRAINQAAASGARKRGA